MAWSLFRLGILGVSSGKDQLGAETCCRQQKGTGARRVLTSGQASRLCRRGPVRVHPLELLADRVDEVLRQPAAAVSVGAMQVSSPYEASSKFASSLLYMASCDNTPGAGKVQTLALCYAMTLRGLCWSQCVAGATVEACASWMRH